MEKTVIVEDLYKAFKLSKKQIKLSKAKSNIKKAVDGVSFETYKGEIFGLVGPNGAGKTTTLRCIATLLKPDIGRITIDGIDTTNDIEVKKRIAFLTNDLRLEDNFTPDYLFNHFSSLYNMQEEEIKKRKDILFTKLGIDKFLGVKIKDLSQGMRQKVSIAISLVHNPDIIIFDEPTNGLDVVTARMVTDYLIELKKEGKTIIISSHIMSLIEKICDRIGIIIDGKLVAYDTVSRLKSINPDLEEYFFLLFKENLISKGEI